MPLGKAGGTRARGKGPRGALLTRPGGGRGPSRVPGAAQLAVFPWQGQRSTKEDCLSCLRHYPDGDRGESGELGWRVRRTRPESPPAVAVRPGNTVDAGSSFGRQGTRRLFPALPLLLSPPLGPAAQPWTHESGGGKQTENPGRKLLAFPAAPRGRRGHTRPLCFSGSNTGVWGCSVRAAFMRTRMGSSLRDEESDVYEL